MGVTPHSRPRTIRSDSIAEDWLRLSRPLFIPVHLRGIRYADSRRNKTGPLGHRRWRDCGVNRGILVGWMGHRRQGRSGCNATGQRRGRNGSSACLRRKIPARYRRLGQSRRAQEGRFVVAGDFVEKGGWATAPGSKPPEQLSAVAKACASLLVPA